MIASAVEFHQKFGLAMCRQFTRRWISRKSGRISGRRRRRQACISEAPEQPANGTATGRVEATDKAGNKRYPNIRVLTRLRIQLPESVLVDYDISESR